ncbi:MAG: hypothetical protein ABUS49_12895 [Acidobacteriota bacterium]
MLEQSLGAFQTQVEASLAAAGTLLKHLKKLRAGAQRGDLRDIGKSLGDVKQAAPETVAQAEALSFEFDDSGYFPGVFLNELEGAAKERGLTVFLRDGKLYCYPLLVRVKAAERAVQIGKRMERGIRPSALAAKLQQLQSKPTRFKPEDFLHLLHRAYQHCAGAGESSVLTLAEIYDVLTLMPGSGKEYTKDDFARDLYLLDSSGTTQLDNGTQFRFAASTGTRNASATFVCIAGDGSEKRYYGISFEKGGPGQ